ncbi:MAG: hypothetical protein AB7F96_22255 [Beijerinckiaceae bacterium]
MRKWPAYQNSGGQPLTKGLIRPHTLGWLRRPECEALPGWQVWERPDGTFAVFPRCFVWTTRKGTVGHSIEMEPGEIHEAAFRRYCAKNNLTFVDTVK